LKHILFFWLALFSTLTIGQELPPILKFSPDDYSAGNQNWMISQAQNKFLYFANNDGLLEYNGTEWALYPSPNETIIRSVNVIDNRIYTGCYMDFGYWIKEPNGLLKYTSLTKKIKNKIQDDEQFWNILSFERWIIFQSLSQIFIYDTKSDSFQIINPKTPISKAFVVENSIYFQTLNGLFEIENGQSKLYSNDPFFIQNKIVSILKHNDSLLIVTQYRGIYEFKNNKLEKWITDSDQELNESSVYCAQKNSSNGLIIGTVSNGIFIIDENKKTKYQITQNKGISNNTALSLFEDVDKNIWIGLDNGINCLNLTSPIRSYSDDSGLLGTVYCSILYHNKVYIGTNQGLFYRDLNGSTSFQLISGTKGQIWSLFEYQDELFCGHDVGTFIIKDSKAISIFNESGTWKFEPVLGNENKIIQGNYHGLSILEKKNGSWQFLNKIEGFEYSSKYFEWIKPNEILISHEYKGLFRIKLNSSLSKTTDFEDYKTPLKGKNAGLAKFNSTVYYCSKEGIYSYNQKSNSFKREAKLSRVIENNEYISGKLITDNSKKLWLFSKNYINYFTYGKLSSELEHHLIPIPSSLTNSLLGYENITQLSESLYLIGTTDGYYTINLNELNFGNYQVNLTKVSSNKHNESIHMLALNKEGEFKSDENNFSFYFTVPGYNKYITAEYQYLLEGNQEEWSEWSSKSTINFKNLSPGKYTFKVRAKIGNAITENTELYTFTISKPWYITNLALIIYSILLLILAFFINKAYQNYYKQQHEKIIEENNRLLEIKELENEQELMRLKNLQLEQDYESKNKELAASTMTLIKKNELLTMIKDDLKGSSDSSGISKSLKSVISTINKNINEEDSWSTFVDAFNNADKDFLKKIKAAHPSLTPNDLRLTAYLRLNLSSKEIAPLLNISVRSVEIKRYRLRKKIDLTHEQGLVEYILSI
jgi:AraC family transcriptional regulator, chitin signaling transcriptional activator